MSDRAGLSAVSAALRGMFPASIATAVETLTFDGDDLWPEERAAIAGAVPARQSEFRAGRRAARRALAELGLPECGIPMGPDRAPLWPPGIFGAIAHAAGFAVAVAGRNRPLGVDIEEDQPIADDLWTTICDPSELAHMQVTDLGRQVRRAFAAKEAVFKAQHPLSRGLFGFDAVRVTLAPTGFDAHFLQDAGAYPAGSTVAGSLVAVKGVILAGVIG